MTATDPETVVRNMLKAWEARDLDAIMEYFDDEAVYQNVPLDPVSGPEKIREFIGGILCWFLHIDVVIHNQISDGEIVMNERTDTVRGEAGKDVPLRVMGIFKIRDGKVVEWRDYFDSATLTQVFDPKPQP
jgi:limonene-1,2-epoxide hydrolase